MHRLDHGVADEADDQQPRHDVHGDVVGLRLRHAVIDLILADVVDEHRTEHAGRRPRRDQPAVDGADVARAEHVLQIGRHGGEAAAVHADDDDEAQHEQRHAADRAGPWDGAVQDGPEHEEAEIGVLAPDIVRRGGPEETARHVEQAQ